MKYAIVRNNGLVTNPSENCREPKRGERKIKCVYANKLEDIILKKESGFELLKLTGAKAIFQMKYIDASLAESKDTAFVLIEKKRKEKEEAGVIFDGDVFPVTEKNKNRLMGIWVSMQIDPGRIIDQKIKSGKHKEVGKAEIDALSIAVINHTQNCFSRESEIVGLINAAETRDEVKSIIDSDMGIGWPE